MVSIVDEVKILESNFLERIKLPENPNDFPYIDLVIGSCRVGSTAKVSLWAASGFEAHRQPIKSGIYRNLLFDQNKDFKWGVPNKETLLEERMMVKETIGPYSETESNFNPFNVLTLAIEEKYGTFIASSIIPEKVNVVILTRDPFDAWESWVKNWSESIGIDKLYRNFETSIKTVDFISKQASDYGVLVTFYDYEANKTPLESTSELFFQLGIQTKPIVSNWRHILSNGARKNIVIPPEPSIYLPSQVHKKVQHSDGLGYNEKRLDVLVPYLSVLKSSNILELYNSHKLKSI